MTEHTKGIVYLVGAGPGDPGLVTRRGLEVLQQADCVVYDYLANEGLLAAAPVEAEIIFVGKRGGDHTRSQNEINQLLVEKARAGMKVVRLKGGDPYIFGRGGEEAEELAQHRIPFEVVPGISSAVAVPAYAGIPLTHRRYASLVSFITGHEDPAKPESAIPWEVLAQSPGTLVFLMGVKNLAEITRQLQTRGKSAQTPAAVIQRGTTPAQRTVTGTLEDIANLVQAAGLAPPAILVVGEVVQLRPQLNWFETRPLWGKRIVVTRSRDQASAFVKLLAEQGATCLEVPTIQIQPPDSYADLDQALRQLSRYDWLILTSTNGVKAFMVRLFQSGQDVRALGSLKIAAIGAATAQALREYGLIADCVPTDYRAEGLVESLTPQIRPGSMIVLPRAQVARELLPQELEKRGVLVHVVPAYKTVPAPGLPPEAEVLFQQSQVDVLTFTSSSTVTHFAALVGEARFPELAADTIIAAIGPITAQTLERYGLHAQIQPQNYTIPDLTRAIVAYFQNGQG
ncbi:MAG: uroporphyrinogen-III C-methyltransferase [Deltaproteobacteria bacterium]|nr:uroporphyrinogen-III C-methyltransferase [Deltaproteobacteria bacterium]MBW1953354.1 uroporphyrinogen-III C-methyltransferase [Deltaproteobacteria bacterium]MBW1986715.1 uroporphyrinogen-III C-methyltransferase [Deltaproteobacteria bacterium]